MRSAHLGLALDLLGTVTFALNRAWTASRRVRLDVVGVLSLGVITAIGGGLVRDTDDRGGWRHAARRPGALGAVGCGAVLSAVAVGGLLGSAVVTPLERALGAGVLLRACLLVDVAGHLACALTRSAAVALAAFGALGPGLRRLDGLRDVAAPAARPRGAARPGPRGLLDARGRRVGGGRAARRCRRPAVRGDGPVLAGVRHDGRRHRPGLAGARPRRRDPAGRRCRGDDGVVELLLDEPVQS